MASTGVRFIFDEAAIASLTATSEAAALTEAVSKEFADVARGLAPKRTGAGAASISGDLTRAREGGQFAPGYESHVSWDSDHAYMYFQELGTVHMAAHPFLSLALDRYAQF